MAASGSPSGSSPQLNIDLHVQYIQNLDQRKDLMYHHTEHLRLNGVYWGLTALCIMGRKDALNREAMIDYVMSCWDEEEGAFGAHTGHDAHIHATLSAIQILVMQDAMDRIDKSRLVKFLLARINPDGSISGDSYGETDTRFTYILIQSLTLLGELHAIPVDQLERIVQHVKGSMNFDGGFGREPGGESHGSQVWVCVGALALLDRLDLVDCEMTGWWLSERQLPNGGLNGRPEKLEDVCYSWWNLAALSIVGKPHWINRDKLVNFILGAQDLEDGGIADRPGDWVDVFHTVFGLAGLSLLGYPGLEDIDPVCCLPASLTKRLGIQKPYKTFERLLEYPAPS